MSRQWKIATCATAIVAVAAAAIVAASVPSGTPDVSVAADMQTRPAVVQMAQFNPCPNGKCKF
jgi:anti-sigma-K factor RskA